MGERTKEDIREARKEKEKTLRHEDTLEVCNSNKCVEVKRKLKKTEGEDLIEE